MIYFAQILQISISTDMISSVHFTATLQQAKSKHS